MPMHAAHQPQLEPLQAIVATADRTPGRALPLLLRSARAGGAAIALHHEAGAASGDVGDDGGASMKLRDGAQIDGESQNDLLALAQPEIGGLDEDAGCAEIDRLAQLTAASWNHDIDNRPSTVPRMQAAFH